MSRQAPGFSNTHINIPQQSKTPLRTETLMHLKSSECPISMQSLLEPRGLVVVVADTPPCMLWKAPRWNAGCGLAPEEPDSKPLGEVSTDTQGFSG